MIEATSISADDPLEDAVIDDEVVSEHRAGAVQRIMPRRRTAWYLAMAAVLLGLGAVAALHARGKGYKSRILRQIFPNNPAYMIPPSIAMTRPGNYESGVPVDAFISADVHLPNSGRVVDPETLNEGSVRLLKVGEKAPVPARLNTSAAGDVVVLQPLEPLEFDTQYQLDVLPALKDTGGKGFSRYTMNFTTAAGRDAIRYPAAFEKVHLPSTHGVRYTGLTVGPDHKLYACTYDGRVTRFTLNSDGTTSASQVLPVTLGAGEDTRVATGIRFDPSSTANNLVLWVTHAQWVHGSEGGRKRAAGADWTGKVSRLSGPNLQTRVDYVVGLPRSSRDHLTNQMDFGPDGCLYVAQASNTAMGAPDSSWGYRHERKLSASILRVDLAAIHSPPLDVKTGEGGTYDPFAPGAPLTIYASGVRNAYDLVWHRNGNLYAPLNGSSAGGNTPETPDNVAAVPRRLDYDRAGPYTGPRVAPLSDVRLTAVDVMERILKGAYYGHPNPTLGEYVLNCGNPTAGPDPDEVPQYPVGTRPDRNWRPPVWRFGQHWAPCGVIEFKGDAFGGTLDGKLLVARYSGGKDVVALTPGQGGDVAEAIVGIDGLTGFGDPLDLTQDAATGFLYVAEFGESRITLLRPKHGVESTRVFRQAR